ncbi:hypothetical protein ACFQL4_20445 [Halosimplex aquaticum]
MLVSIDLQAALAPDAGRTDARLRKAAVLTEMLAEEAVEIRWLGNDTERIRTQRRQAAQIRRDAARFLALAAEDAPPERVASVRSTLRDAEREVEQAVHESGVAAPRRTDVTRSTGLAASPSTAGERRHAPRRPPAATIP